MLVVTCIAYPIYLLLLLLLEEHDKENITEAFEWAGQTQALHGLQGFHIGSPALFKSFGESCSVRVGLHTPHAQMGVLQADTGLL